MIAVVSWCKGCQCSYAKKEPTYVKGLRRQVLMSQLLAKDKKFYSCFAKVFDSILFHTRDRYQVLKPCAAFLSVKLTRCIASK